MVEWDVLIVILIERDHIKEIRNEQISAEFFINPSRKNMSLTMTMKKMMYLMPRLGQFRLVFGETGLNVRRGEEFHIGFALVSR